ncbi:hypothetical protein [Parabacteroides distasonis]|uniref:Uncharacterized protein n=1 Tax=Parabacteroides distasonis TaxID=823 RepID=A0AAW6F1C7_PARDI|nr:hypothetical protein [Parabacteroides distasonis]MDB9136971.1 hypothetical protein [Parabacteroides distasonis]MDB9141404.1 hypothetical protein [Parabacteroides distasonis]
MDNDLKGLFKRTLVIKEDRHYWLVRSMGGDFYNEYISRGYIAIGYNEISLAEIKLSASHNDEAVNTLKKIIDSKESISSVDVDDINPQYAAIQLLKFYRDIQIGDIIVIPGKSSDQIAIARVESSVYEEKEEDVSKLSGICNFRKRRRIKIINRSFRSKLNPKMQLMFSSRHIVSNADNYAQYIDSCISDYYQKDGNTFLVLRVKEEDSISADDFGLVPDLIGLLKDYSEEIHLNINVQTVKMKTCVQSPGDILMYATSWEAITLIGMFIMIIKGGEFSITKGDGLKIKVGTLSEATEKTLKSLSDFLDRRRDRAFKESLQKKLDNMKIETPEDLTKVMKEFNDKRESY